VKSKLSKWLKGIIITLVVLVVAAVIGFQVFFRLAVPKYTGNLDIAGLTAPVEVRTDEYGIPHIFAENDEDLFFAQGYITARERMFQMDLTRLAGKGELSTLFGETTIESDRYFKTLGFYRAAQGEYDNLTPETKLAVDAYARGVNAYLDTVKHLPREYVILGGKPAAWEPADSLVGAILMSFRLNSTRSIKPILHQIHENAGANVLNDLLPWIPEQAPVISGESNESPMVITFDAAQQTSGALPEMTLENFYSPIPLRIRASNWMVFSGDRTTTGNAIFTGSPDLEAVIPALFYLVHLSSPSYDVIGGSIPGVPGVHALGFNGNVAWSITVGNGDNLDFIIETLNPENEDQYLTEEGYTNFTIINDIIKIKEKGGFLEEEIKIKTSRHGPVISEVVGGLPANTAMMWPGLMGSDGTLNALLTVNRAKNFEEFRSALSMAQGGSVHVGYADIAGNIGYQYITTLPIRKSGTNPVPVPGEADAFGWTGFVPFDEHPYAINPEKGYLASFNQMPEVIDEEFYGTAYFMFERPYRFEAIVRSQEKFSVEEIRHMQNDTGSHVAERFIPLIVEAASAEETLAPYIEMLVDWDKKISLDSVEATLFNAFIDRLIYNTLADDIGSEVVKEFYKGLSISIPLQWLIRYSDQPDHYLWDDSTTTIRENRDDTIVKSLYDAIDLITGLVGANQSKWEWGQVHKMPIRHTLGEVLPFLNLGPYAYPGDDFTIHAGWWDHNNPFEMKSGACIRIVVDMADLSTMTLISPPGQSGHYLSPHYGDLVDLWAEGKQIPAHYTTAKELDKVLMLNPVQ
jgi:penicillin G amidase